MTLQENTPSWRTTTPKRRKPVSLFRFLTDAGGLKPCGELRVLLDGAHGWMIRNSGMPLDRAREACVEAGYLRGTDWECGVDESTINDLLELIDAEARGAKQYPYGEWDFNAEAEAHHARYAPAEECGEAVGAASPATPSTRRSRGPKSEVNSMNDKQYITALKRLGLTPAGKLTAEVLGISLRQAQRIAAGECAVPGPAAKLLRLMIRERLSPEDVAAL